MANNLQNKSDEQLIERLKISTKLSKIAALPAMGVGAVVGYPIGRLYKALTSETMGAGTGIGSVFMGVVKTALVVAAVLAVATYFLGAGIILGAMGVAAAVVIPSFAAARFAGSFSNEAEAALKSRGYQVDTDNGVTVQKVAAPATTTAGLSVQPIANDFNDEGQKKTTSEAKPVPTVQPPTHAA